MTRAGIRCKADARSSIYTVHSLRERGCRSVTTPVAPGLPSHFLVNRGCQFCSVEQNPLRKGTDAAHPTSRITSPPRKLPLPRAGQSNPSSRRDMIVIAPPGWGQDADRTQSKEAGCDGHLVKPVSLSDLETLLTELERAAAPRKSNRRNNLQIDCRRLRSDPDRCRFLPLYHVVDSIP